MRDDVETDELRESLKERSEGRYFMHASRQVQVMKYMLWKVTVNMNVMATPKTWVSDAPMQRGVDKLIQRSLWQYHSTQKDYSYRSLVLELIKR